MTKKQNRRHTTRKERRVLNNNIEFFTKVSGYKLQRFHYRGVITENNVKDTWYNE